MPRCSLRLLVIVTFSWLVRVLAAPLPAGPAEVLPYISEFMASNTRTLADENREYADWIEIHNPGTTPINLDGWSLTDSADELARWRFPATNLAGGAFLVVFASEKNRRVPGAPLHTNFKLSVTGEYLALVKPDGLTVVSEFRPEFPSQVPDVSFGRGLLSSETRLVEAGAPVRALVPSPANGGHALGQSWIGTTNTDVFDDGAWRSGTTGVGFAGASRLVASNALVVRFAFDAAPVANVIVDSKPIGTLRPGLNAGAVWAESSTDTAPTPRTRTGVMEFTAAEGDQIRLTARPEFNSIRGTICFWMRSAGAIGPGAYGSILFDRRANTYTGPGDVIVMQDDGRLFVQAGNGSTGGVNAFATDSSVNDNQWHHVAYVYDQTSSGSIAFYVDGELAGRQNNTTSWSWSPTQEIQLGRSYDAFWRRLEGGLDDFRIYNRQLTVDEIAQLVAGDAAVAPEDIGLNVGAEMANLNASAFLRIPFAVQDPADISLLTLRMKYDDGYVAWINGVEVARANVPSPLAWNSTATAAHAAGSVESIRLSNTPGLLHAGVNILALHGLNASAADPTFLILPELSATAIGTSNIEGLYFTTPTPGEPNLGGTMTPGPIIREVLHTPNVPGDADDLTVTARVQPAMFPLAHVTLRYRIMYGVEVNVPMADDGGHGDGGPGDGVFGAVIPASASTNGQMIRYYISAQDTNGINSRWPLFTDPVNTAEYLGTIVDPTNLVSRLPIVHLFVHTSQQGAVDGDSGGRISVFHDGEFYDNVQMQVRGNTTAGYVKKSHRVEFNREHTFRHPGPGGRVRKTSFMAEFIDPSYVRQYLSFWLMSQAGHNSPYHYPVRLQNNGVFYQLAYHSEVLGEEQAARYGFDPRGVVYKAVGVLSTSPCSTGGGPEKVSREEEAGQADYTALATAIANGVPVAVRRTNLLENVDIPDLINYMAASRLSHEQDDIWANLSIYRDSDGDRLWRMLPFDLNLSWGQLYGNSNVEATNDASVSHPFYGAATIQIGGACGGFNHLQDAVIQVPETRQMFLRRLRTLMDTFLQPPGTPPDQLIIEREVHALTNLFYPEAILDRQRWGWASGGGPGALPSEWLTNGVRNLFTRFLAPRRTHLFVHHSISNTARALGLAVANNAGIPFSQPANTTLQIVALEPNPESHRQDQEFLCLSNPAPFAVDVSGWRVEGGIDFDLKPGTVVSSNGLIFLSPDLNGFRSRVTGPRGRLGLFVVAPYRGQLSARGEALRVVNAGGQVVHTFSYPGAPSLAQQYLRVTEVMYHPSPHAASVDPDDFEFIELRNISPDVTLDLTGVRLTNGVDFVFAGSAITTLAPGARVLVVHNLIAFRARYGNGPPVAGQFSGALNNDGERLQLLDSNNEEILDFRFEDDWYPITDGLGFSLVVVDEQAEADAWGTREQWRTSGAPGGSPGVNEPAPTSLPSVWITEVLTRSETPPPTDSIELHNPTSTSADISGWWLTDDFNTPQKFRIPDGTELLPGAYRVFDEADFNQGGAGFALGSDGDEVWLFSAQAGGALTGYVHGYQFGAAENGVSFGRHVTTDDREYFVAQTARTLGSPNAGPRVGPVVINEIHYRPPAVGTNDNQTDEFIELLNTTGAPLGLFELAHPTNTWRVRGGVDFAFPEQVTLGAGEAVLLVSFDPIADTEAMSRFVAAHRLAPGVRVWGPYQGQLSNSGEEVQLQKPTTLAGGVVAYVVMDNVNYRDESPWPDGADGFGLSLQRRAPGAFGEDPASWTAAPTTAGASTQDDESPLITEQPQGSLVVAGNTALLSVDAQGGQPLQYQWRSNGTNVPGATNGLLTLPNVQPGQAGDYSVVVFNRAGSVVSATAALRVLAPVVILQQPRNVNISPTSNATFSVVAYGSLPVRYQWFKDGLELAGATSASLFLPGVQPESAGVYSVVVSDDYRSVTSAPATLIVLVVPTIVQQPLSQSVTPGTRVVLSLTVTNTASLPLTVIWRRNGSAFLTNSVNARTAFLTIANAQPNFTLYQAVVGNPARSTGFPSSTATLTFVSDRDGDGMPDAYETAYFDGDTAGDPNADLDGDLMSNYGEYLAGTDPLDPMSFLGLDGMRVAPGAALRFQARSERTYTVEYSDTWEPATWRKLVDVGAHATNHVEVIQVSTPVTNRFYRVLTPRQP